MRSERHGMKAACMLSAQIYRGSNESTKRILQSLLLQQEVVLLLLSADR